MVSAFGRDRRGDRPSRSLNTLGVRGGSKKRSDGGYTGTSPGAGRICEIEDCRRVRGRGRRFSSSDDEVEEEDEDTRR